MNFDIFGKKTQRQIHRIKNLELESRFEEKLLNEQERNFQKIKSRKTKIEIEIDSNYDLKLKSKAIRRKIRMKQDH